MPHAVQETRARDKRVKDFITERNLARRAREGDQREADQKLAKSRTRLIKVRMLEKQQQKPRDQDRRDLARNIAATDKVTRQVDAQPPASAPGAAAPPTAAKGVPAAAAGAAAPAGHTGGESPVSAMVRRIMLKANPASPSAETLDQMIGQHRAGTGQPVTGAPSAGVADPTNPNPMIGNVDANTLALKDRIATVNAIQGGAPFVGPGRVTPGGVASIQGGGGFAPAGAAAGAPAAQPLSGPTGGPTGGQAAQAFIGGDATTAVTPEASPIADRIALLAQDVARQERMAAAGITPARERLEAQRAHEVALTAAANPPEVRTTAPARGLRTPFSSLSPVEQETVLNEAFDIAQAEYDKAKGTGAFAGLSPKEQKRLTFLELIEDKKYILDEVELP